VVPKSASRLSGSFTDTSDGKVYQTIKIGNHTWMAQNLNYTILDSWCYDNDSSNCDKYGRLYTWDAATSACPDGWRLPAREDWENLVKAVGGRLMEDDDGTNYWGIAGKKLKSKTGWDICFDPNSGQFISCNGNGTDDHDFSALAGGYRHNDDFMHVGLGGSWWSATGGGLGYAFTWDMGSRGDGIYVSNNRKSSAFSVRCLQDATAKSSRGEVDNDNVKEYVAETYRCGAKKKVNSYVGYKTNIVRTTEFFQNGNLKAEHTYDKNILNGPFKIYSEKTGKMIESGEYLNGQYHGDRIMYNENSGMKKSRAVYENGTRTFGEFFKDE